MLYEDFVHYSWRTIEISAGLWSETRKGPHGYAESDATRGGRPAMFSAVDPGNINRTWIRIDKQVRAY